MSIPHIYQNIIGYANEHDQGTLMEYILYWLDTSKPLHIVEIGVNQGRGTALWNTILLNHNIEYEYYAVDLYDHGDGRDYLEISKQNTQSIPHTIHFIKNASTVEAQNYPNNYFDIIYIDAEHDYNSIYNDIVAWHPKLKKNGIICGDDYRQEYNGVIQAVNKLFNDNFYTLGEFKQWWVHHYSLPSTTKLLVSIAFHYSPISNHFIYLSKVIDNLLTYPIQVSIVIDTNSQESKDLILKQYPNIQVVVWDNLHDPFHLTSQHRSRFFNEIDNYDYFYYTEDDMLLPFENFLQFTQHFNTLYSQHAIPSFIRVEEFNHTLYNTDNIHVQISPSIHNFHGKQFIQLSHPYHAFWILPQDVLKESFKTKKEEFLYPYNTKCPYFLTRECAASFPICSLGLTPLVELNDEKKIKQTSYSFHLPNNYASDSTNPAGSITLDNLVLWQQQPPPPTIPPPTIPPPTIPPPSTHHPFRHHSFFKSF